MREVSGKYTAREAHDCPSRKPTEVGGGNEVGKSQRNPSKKRVISNRWVSPLRGRVWGYPNRGGFLQGQSEFPSESTTILNFVRLRTLRVAQRLLF